MSPEQSGVAAQPPMSVQNAVKAWLAAIVLGVIGIVVTFTMTTGSVRDAARQALQNSGQHISDSALNQGILIGKISTVVVAVIIYALWLLFIFKMRGGRNWARITLTVLGVLWVIFAIVGLGSQTTVGLILEVLELIAVIGALVFMFRPDSKAYFQSSQQRR